MIKIDGLQKSFITGRNEGPVSALTDVNITITDREFLTVVGPSGCGKTTLLRTIAGLVAPDYGTVTLDGHLVDGPSPERAMVFQNFALMPWASVIDNIAFGLELRGVPKRIRRERAKELSITVGLSGFGEHYPKELSGGMQQRVGLARALAVEPSVLLMDEPFGSLDEQTRRFLQEWLMGLWESTSLTVVFITHSTDEAVLLGDRVVLMAASGRIEDVVSVPIKRPRSNDLEKILGSSAFAEVTARLWGRVRDMHKEAGNGIEEVKVSNPAGTRWSSPSPNTEN